MTDYWVEGDTFHYRTTLGGESSVPLDRIDFERTITENAQRGVAFKISPYGVPVTPPSGEAQPAGADSPSPPIP